MLFCLVKTDVASPGCKQRRDDNAHARASYSNTLVMFCAFYAKIRTVGWRDILS